jgi:hypothetical protein
MVIVLKAVGTSERFVVSEGVVMRENALLVESVVLAGGTESLAVMVINVMPGI